MVIVIHANTTLCTVTIIVNVADCPVIYYCTGSNGMIMSIIWNNGMSVLLGFPMYGETVSI